MTRRLAAWLRAAARPLVRSRGPVEAPATGARSPEGRPGTDGHDPLRAILEEKVEERTRELRLAYEQLKTVDEMKDAFLSSVSHELRTPLSSIRSFSEILLTYDEDPDTRREFIGIINQESERLTRLIDDLLDIARIEAGAVTWETRPVRLADVCERAGGTFSVLARQKRQQLRVEVPPGLPYVSADPDRLIQVLTNLLSNAVKFTPEGGTITLRALVDGASGAPARAMVRIVVQDDGPGVPPDQKEAIFEKFRQGGDTLTDKPKGSGLGLAITREIVRHLGGTVWAEGAPGGGSRFCFTLPQAAAPDPEAASPPRGEGRYRLRVAVADDDAQLVELLSILLRERGCGVWTATNGDQALAIARAGGLDLLILDLNMPHRSGWEVLRALRADPATRNLPVIVLTGMKVEMDRARALSLGALEYLEKGRGLDRLISEIDLLLPDRAAPGEPHPRGEWAEPRGTETAR